MSTNPSRCLNCCNHKRAKPEAQEQRIKELEDHCAMMENARGKRIDELQSTLQQREEQLRECVKVMEMSKHEHLGHRVSNEWFIARDKALSKIKELEAK